MSYCRWTDGDVYAYESDRGVEFWIAGDKRIAGDKSLDRVCRTHIEAYQYAKELRDVHGISIPDYAIETLREEAVDERERLLGIEVGK